ncbi:hypothetical protein NEMIN01_1436 [Nematocida minor]|uniref:uncharacterized protein n=1 Tax=Nematocida minor TaxID=1912983 RepID=UPI00221F5944|nr:uncharacterized protein NEMIN01_1436 [Nematocida minor]KAI5191228.1 hypothetical protein NEMIN01_1436 [Nematocida minor]
MLVQRVNGDFFSARRSLVVFVYVLLLLLNKASGLLKNLEIIRYFKNAEQKKIMLYGLTSILSYLKDLLIIPVEMDYLSMAIYSKHHAIMRALENGGSEDEIRKLIVEKEAEIEISETRIRYSKRYSMYAVKSAVIIALLYSTGIEVFIITVLFLAVDLFIKQKKQKIEEEKQTVHLKYTVALDRVYSQIAAYNHPIESTQHAKKEHTAALRHAHRSSTLQYKSQSTVKELQKSLFTVLETVVFCTYVVISITVLCTKDKDMEYFIIIYKKVDKLTKYFMKVF